jgi:SAM-dependent methyltransferase
MGCNPKIVLHRETGKPKISVILIDWGVRESFHSLHYLNRQTASREDYELIWLEFYQRKPEALRRLVADGNRVLDKWYVLGYPDDFIFHKHRLYNVGLLAATGDICVICDSDAVFSPTFIDNLLAAFRETPQAVIHLDEVRNNDRRFYPFNYPQIDEILREGCLNWQGATTSGLATGVDRIHGANYGACMAARRQDLLAVSGADEHLDYLGYICGPYDLTFRLANYGRLERWLHNEYLYHAWHPNTSGINADYQGPHDGLCMSLLSLNARATGRIEPYLKSPLFDSGAPASVANLLDCLRTNDDTAWRNGNQPAGPPDTVYLVEKNYKGRNVFAHKGRWYAVPRRVTTFNPAKVANGDYRSFLEAATLQELHAKIAKRLAATLINRVRCKFSAQPRRGQPVVLDENYLGFQIVLCEKFLALAANPGDSDECLRRTDRDSAVYSADRLEVLKSRIHAGLAGLPGARRLTSTTPSRPGTGRLRLSDRRVAGERRRRLQRVAKAFAELAVDSAATDRSGQGALAKLLDGPSHKGYAIATLDGEFRAFLSPAPTGTLTISKAGSLAAASEASLKRTIDAITAELVEQYRGYAVFRYEYKFFALPDAVQVYLPEDIIAAAQESGVIRHTLPEIHRAIDALIVASQASAPAQETLFLETLPRGEMARVLRRYPREQITVLGGAVKAAPPVPYPVIEWQGASANGRACFGRQTIDPALLSQLKEQRFGHVVVPWGKPESWDGAGAEELAGAISENLEILQEDGSRRRYQGENAHRIVYNKAYLSSMFKVVPDVKGRAVLDVGCSDGLVCDIFARLGARKVVGIDVMQTVGCAFPDPTVEYHVMDGGCMHFPDGTFDVGCSIATMEHVPDPFAVMMEIKRVLKVGGYGYVQAGPLYHSPFGHHMFAYFQRYPWIHLRRSADEIIAFARATGVDQQIMNDLGTDADAYIRSMLNKEHINGLFLSDYRLDEFMAQSDIEVLKMNVSYEGKDLLSSEIDREINGIEPERLTEHGFELAFRKLR